ncbi:substrate-binding periplasmic protein [Desulfocurvus vexinensis]|uniref:substrate-binding periplasmic protein n=1 Tax=Desulfocurvus vexinensis TaxID=399548 RepID=UPI00048ED4A3|nr:transporter substrate-binding domain-containing protein [Desulfocurvus vexinensis]
MRTILWLLLALLLPLPADASEPLPDPGGITAVHVVGPSWEGFTNMDGTGLYHDTLRAVFGLYGIEYVREYVPSERAYHMVRDGSADMMTCHDKPPRGLTLAGVPMYEGKYYVFFNRENIGQWSVPGSLEGRTIAWRIGYYDLTNLPAPMQHKELKSGVSALGMVILGRIDFYLDDLNFIEDSIHKNTIPFDMARFRIEPVGARGYFPVLKDTERGRKIRELYERGMEHLYRAGRLQAIFDRWGFPLPAYAFD